MVFSSAIFLLAFLPIVFVVNSILPHKWSNVFLLVASLFFYAWGEPVYCILMVATIVFNWIIGMGIQTEIINRKLCLIIGILGDVLILGYFKYAVFLSGIVNTAFGRNIVNVGSIALPIGISFFTFQAISYIVDVYRGQTQASGNIINVALYISYFPQLIAGPIVKYKEINSQIEERTITSSGVAAGFRRFIYGLSKKVIIANILGKSADIIFDYDLSTIGMKTAWIGAIVYTLQIYYDFSGYSDMAIGLGQMFGFDIPENFNLPYLSRSVSEFWRRWHMSLGSWFREYVYIPLGGNRKGNRRTLINLFIVFFLTGLWHGASFSFIAWGLWHGILSIIERKGLDRYLQKYKVLSHIYLLMAVTIGWVIFRINNLPRAFMWIVKMFNVPSLFGSDIACGYYMNNITIFVLIVAVLGCGVVRKLLWERFNWKWKNTYIEWVACAILLVLSISCIAGDTYNPFIYFNF